MTTVRESLALAAQAALLAAGTLAGNNVFLWRDWPLNNQTVPALVVRCRRVDREDLSGGNGIPHFRVLVWLEIEGFTAAPGAEATVAEANAETLEDQATAAILYWFTQPPRLFRRVAQMPSDVDVDASGDRHLGTLDLKFGFETAQFYSPVLTDALEGMRIAAVKRFKANGGRAGQHLTKVLSGADFDVPQ